MTARNVNRDRANLRQALRFSLTLVVASQRLLAAALQEPRNQRFVMLSESCAPAMRIAHFAPIDLGPRHACQAGRMGPSRLARKGKGPSRPMIPNPQGCTPYSSPALHHQPSVQLHGKTTN